MVLSAGNTVKNHILYFTESATCQKPDICSKMATGK